MIPRGYLGGGVGRSIGQSISQSVSQSVSQAASQRVNQAVSHSVRQAGKQAGRASVSRLVTQRRWGVDDILGGFLDQKVSGLGRCHVPILYCLNVVGLGMHRFSSWIAST